MTVSSISGSLANPNLNPLGPLSRKQEIGSALTDGGGLKPAEKGVDKVSLSPEGLRASAAFKDKQAALAGGLIGGAKTPEDKKAAEDKKAEDKNAEGLKAPGDDEDKGQGPAGAAPAGGGGGTDEQSRAALEKRLEKLQKENEELKEEIEELERQSDDPESAELLKQKEAEKNMLQAQVKMLEAQLKNLSQESPGEKSEK